MTMIKQLVQSSSNFLVRRSIVPLNLPSYSHHSYSTATPPPSSSKSDADATAKPASSTPGGTTGAGGEEAPRTEGSSTRAKAFIGPFSIRAAGLFAFTGTALYFYFQREKAKVEARKRAETATAKVGKPKIGGPFVLTDQDGQPFTQKDLLGKWSLVYFGFTNCPDICPEELDKMAKVIDAVEVTNKVEIMPVFITCDPVRDTIAAVKAYVQDFHPRLVGLTGTYEDIKKCCKVYRVYFSTPPTALPTDDYLVDHSIFFYLMDPTGQFVDAFGRSMGIDEVGTKIKGYLKEWEAGGGRGGWTP